MTVRTDFLEFFMENPRATNDDVANALNMTKGYAKTLLSQLKASGVLKVTEIDGERNVIVNSERIHNRRVETNLRRAEKIDMLLDMIIEGLMYETNFATKLEAGRLIVKILDRV